MKTTISIGVIFASLLIGTVAPLPANAQAAAALPTHAVTLNMQGADIRTVLDAIFRGSGINYTIDPSVTGSVTLNLTDVPFDVALRTALRSDNLTYSVQDGVYDIKPRNATPSAAAPAATSTEQLSGTTEAVRIPLMYIDAAQLMKYALGGGTVIPPLNMGTAAGGMGASGGAMGGALGGGGGLGGG